MSYRSDITIFYSEDIQNMSIQRFVDVVARKYSRWLDSKGRIWLITAHFASIDFIDKKVVTTPSSIELVDLSSEESVTLGVEEFKNWIIADHFKRLVKPVKFWH